MVVPSLELALFPHLGECERFKTRQANRLIFGVAFVRSFRFDAVQITLTKHVLFHIIHLINRHVVCVLWPVGFLIFLRENFRLF